MAEIVRAYRQRFPVGPSGAAFENLIFADSQYRVPPTTSGLWDDCPSLVHLSDPSYAYSYVNDFTGSTPASNTIGGWTSTIATSGTATASATAGLAVSAGAVTAGQGVNLQMARTPVTMATGKAAWLEGQFTFTGLTSLKIQFLFGFAAAQTALITGSAIGTDDKAAFDGVTTTGVIQTDTTLATASTTGTGFTIVNNGVYKLGIKLTPTAASYWVNGVMVTTTTTNIPAAALAPSLVVTANASVTPVVNVNWLKFFSIR